VSVFGRDNEGVDVDFEESPDAVAGATRLVLDAEVGLGEVRVHDEQDELEFRDDDFGGHDEPDVGVDGRSACEDTGERASG
jgi:hypothetical protein